MNANSWQQDQTRDADQMRDGCFLLVAGKTQLLFSALQTPLHRQEPPACCCSFIARAAIYVYRDRARVRETHASLYHRPMRSNRRTCAVMSVCARASRGVLVLTRWYTHATAGSAAVSLAIPAASHEQLWFCILLFTVYCMPLTASAISTSGEEGGPTNGEPEGLVPEALKRASAVSLMPLACIRGQSNPFPRGHLERFYSSSSSSTRMLREVCCRWKNSNPQAGLNIIAI